jgi:FAD/FMN-containing dehydrogenase
VPDSGAIRTDLPLRARYSEGAGIYRIVPEAVARPETFEQLRAVIDQAVRSGWRLTPRGTGTAMDGGNVGSGVIVDMTGYDDDRCGLDPGERMAIVAPAVRCATLQRLAARSGLRLPPEPSSCAFATLGGMVSTNASGPRSVRYGSIRRWVHAVLLETADGPIDVARGRPLPADHPVTARWRTIADPLIRRHADIIRARYPHVTKNSAGYALDQYLASGDVLDVVIGSEGTLGIVTDIVLRLDPVPAHRGSVRVALRRRSDLVRALETVRSQDPSTLEYLDASFLRLVAGSIDTPERPGLMSEAAGLLLADIESDDFDDMWQRGAAAVTAVAPMALDARLAIDASEIDRLWSVRHGASPILAALSDGRRSLQIIEDGCVSANRLPDYLDAVDSACAAAGIDAVIFGHAGDGHMHVNLLPDLTTPDWRERVGCIYDAVTAAVLALGGTPSGEHGAGRLRAGILERMYGAEVMACFRAVKEAFDPGSLFNPGVILSDGTGPLDRLKVGGGAALLPPGAAGFLREIESGATWTVPRYF